MFEFKIKLSISFLLQITYNSEGLSQWFAQDGEFYDETLYLFQYYSMLVKPQIFSLVPNIHTYIGT